MPKITGLSQFARKFDPSTGLSGVNRPSVDVEVIGAENLAQVFRTLDRYVQQTAVSVAKYAAYQIKIRSQRIVPWRTGDLHNSAYVTDDTKDYKTPAFEVGYDAPHAWPVHENPGGYEFGQAEDKAPRPYTEKETDHFLQIARDQVASTYRNTVEGYLQEAINEAVARRPTVRAPAGPRLVKKIAEGLP